MTERLPKVPLPNVGPAGRVGAITEMGNHQPTPQL